MTIETKPYKQNYDETEYHTRCRLCAYQLTDIEKELYRKHGERGAYCTFCFSETPYPVGIKKILYWKLFARVDWQIHKAKKEIRDLFYDSPMADVLSAKIDDLIVNHHEEIYPVRYSEEKSKYELEYDKLCEELLDIHRDAKFIYYNKLSDLGVLYTRQLSKEKKKRLLSGLNQAINQHNKERTP